MKNVAVVLLVVPLFAFSQITRSGTFKLNDYVNLSTGTVGSIPIPSERSQVVYPCTTSAVNRDFFMNYFEHSLCICVCPSGAIGSPRPFYQSRKSFAAMNLTTVLDLADTALYTRIDTVRQAAYAGGCALPFIELWYTESGVFIVTTSDHRYALVRISQVINSVQCSDYDPGTGTTYYWNQSRLNGYNVTWYLTNSGQPYFGWVSQTDVASRPMGVTPLLRQNTISPQAEVYSLLGRKVPGILRGKRSRPGIGCPSVYVVKEGHSVRLMLR
jgi:hypothetical protein